MSPFEALLTHPRVLSIAIPTTKSLHSSLRLDLLYVLGMRCSCNHWTRLPIRKLVYPNCSEGHGPPNLIRSSLDLENVLDVGCSNVCNMNVYACTSLFEAMRSNRQTTTPVNERSTNCTMNRASAVNYSTVNTTTTCSPRDENGPWFGPRVRRDVTTPLVADKISTSDSRKS